MRTCAHAHVSPHPHASHALVPVHPTHPTLLLYTRAIISQGYAACAWCVYSKERKADQHTHTLERVCGAKQGSHASLKQAAAPQKGSGQRSRQPHHQRLCTTCGWCNGCRFSRRPCAPPPAAAAAALRCAARLTRAFSSACRQARSSAVELSLGLVHAPPASLPEMLEQLRRRRPRKQPRGAAWGESGSGHGLSCQHCLWWCKGVQPCARRKAGLARRTWRTHDARRGGRESAPQRPPPRSGSPLPRLATPPPSLPPRATPLSLSLSVPPPQKKTHRARATAHQPARHQVERLLDACFADA